MYSIVYSTVKTTIKTFFGERRGAFNIRKNVLLSFFYKAVSIVVSFLLIPLTIHYVNKTQYGIWVALSSVIFWLNFFDIGLGNGLKNKLTEANALGDITSARVYVSTAYALLSIIALVLFCFFLIINHFLSWTKILNATNYYGDDLNTLAVIVVGFFCLQFVIQLINIVLIATHSAAKVSLINALGQITTITVIYILTKLTIGSMYKLVFALAGIPLIIQLIASIRYFNSSYKQYAPGLKYINFGYTKQLLSTGGVFFMIQIGALLLMQTDNIIVTQLFGPGQLTTYNIAFKAFSLIVMVFSIIMLPFWSAYNDAYIRGDFAWIKNAIVKTYKILFVITVCSFILLLASPFVYEHWIGKNTNVPVLLSFSMALYVIGYCSVMANCYLLNGTGKLRLQLYLYIITTIINIPLAIFLAKFWGLAGVMFSNVVIYMFMGVIFHIQSRKIINKTAAGIWNK